MKKEKEKNKPKEQEPPILSEPVAMYQGADISTLKHLMVEKIMNIDDNEKLTLLECFLEEFLSPRGNPPCQFTREELLANIEAARKDFENGDVIIWEELQKDWSTWLK